MFKFIKSMSWFIKKNWYRYILVVFFGLLLTLLNNLYAIDDVRIPKIAPNNTSLG